MIEAGKRYVLRDGRVTQPMHVATGAAWAIVGDNRMSWYIDGTHSVHGTSSFDVIREWREPAVHVEIGTRYLTLDGNITSPMTKQGAHNDYPFGAKVHNVWYTWAQGGMNSKESAKDLVKVWRDSLVIEHGKRYVTRNGNVTGPMYNYVGPHAYRWESSVGGVTGMTWMANGSWIQDGRKHDLDLVRVATLEETGFKIEIGKHYLTRSGEVVGPMREAPRYAQGVLSCKFKGKENGWYPDGRYYLSRKHEWDLVAEVETRAVHVTVPVWEDEEVRLTPDEVKKVRKIIAVFEGGEVFIRSDLK